MVRSAYGKCLREIVPRVKRETKHEIALFATVGIQYWEDNWEGMKVYPGADNKITGEDIIQQHYNNWRADAYILQMDAWCYSQLYDFSAARQINLFQYVPIDYFPLPQYVIQRLQKACGLIAMTKWAEDAMKKAGVENVLGHIHHGVDTEIYKPAAISKEKVRKEFAAMRKQLFGASEDDFLITIVAANQDRKSWFEWLNGIALFIRENPDVNTKIYLHTPMQMGGGYNIPALANLLGIQPIIRTIDPYKYAFGLIGEAEMAKIYNAADVTLIPCIEGFSMPTIESLACGTPVIGLDYGAQQELITPVSKNLLAKVGHEQMYGNALVKPVVSSASIAERLAHIANDRDRYFFESSRYGASFDWNTIVQNGWLPMLKKIEEVLEGECYKLPETKPSTARVIK